MRITSSKKLTLIFIASLFAWQVNAQEEPRVLPENEKQKADEDENKGEKPQKENLDLNWLDGFQTGVEASVENTARWIDDFFGDNRVFDGEYNSRGRLSLGPEWSQYDGWKVRSSFRAQFTLPNTEEKLSAIIGRASVDDFTLEEDTARRGSVIRADRGDQEWIIGLGFNPNQGETNRFSFNAGIRGGLKADLYTQVRYLYQYRIDDYKQIRSRTSLFWRDSDGFGLNQRFDLEKSATHEWLSRFSIDATRAERIDGIRWHSSYAVYHLYDEERAIAGEIWYEGETKEEVPLKEWGIRAIHRRQFARDWLYVELSAGLHWPREELIEQREASWLLGVEFEMWFGD